MATSASAMQVCAAFDAIDGAVYTFAFGVPMDARCGQSHDEPIPVVAEMKHVAAVQFALDADPEQMVETKPPPVVIPRPLPSTATPLVQAGRTVAVKLCRRFQRSGYCTYGEACYFSHNSSKAVTEFDVASSGDSMTKKVDELFLASYRLKESVPSEELAAVPPFPFPQSEHTESVIVQNDDSSPLTCRARISRLCMASTCSPINCRSRMSSL